MSSQVTVKVFRNRVNNKTSTNKEYLNKIQTLTVEVDTLKTTLESKYGVEFIQTDTNEFVTNPNKRGWVLVGRIVE